MINAPGPDATSVHKPDKAPPVYRPQPKTLAITACATRQQLLRATTQLDDTAQR